MTLVRSILTIHSQTVATSTCQFAFAGRVVGQTAIVSGIGMIVATQAITLVVATYLYLLATSVVIDYECILRVVTTWHPLQPPIYQSCHPALYCRWIAAQVVLSILHLSVSTTHMISGTLVSTITTLLISTQI